MEVVISLAIIGFSIWFCVACLKFTHRKLTEMFDKKANELFCKSCGHIGKPAKETPGNIWFEIFLWLLGGLPGFLYSMWRISNRLKTCSVCKSKEVIPSESPIAKSMIEKQKVG